jgi:DNA-binding HxlR family transcriptional regulator
LIYNNNEKNIAPDCMALKKDTAPDNSINKPTEPEDYSRTVELFRLLGDKSRYDIVSALRQGESYPELLAKQVGLTPATVCFHLKKLEAARIVKSRRDQFYIMYSLEPGFLGRTLGELILPRPGAEDELRRAEYEKTVLSSFIKYGRLVSIPVQRKKREIVLREIAKSFEIGRDYDEREANAIIERYHEDYCTIRREMIGMGILTRDRETYRRIK